MFFFKNSIYYFKNVYIIYQSHQKNYERKFQTYIQCGLIISTTSSSFQVCDDSSKMSSSQLHALIFLIAH